MTTTTPAPPDDCPPTPDAAQLALLNALAPADQDAFLASADALTTFGAQDYLIDKHRIAISLAALQTWIAQARLARRARDFEAFLASLRADVLQAQEFCRLLGDTALLERANAFVLSCKLFEALQTGDRPAILDFAHAIATILSRP